VRENPMTQLFTFLIALALLCACDKRSDPTKKTSSSYVLVSSSQNNGLLLKYSTSSNQITQRYVGDRKGNDDYGRFQDAVADEQFVYTLSLTGNVICKISLHDLTLVKFRNSSFSNYHFGATDIIKLHNDKIIVAGSIDDHTYPYKIFVKTLDKDLNLIDSVIVEGPLEIYDLASTDDILFFSGLVDNENKVIVLDATTKETIKILSPDDRFIREFVSAPNNELFGMGPRGMAVINTSSLTITSDFPGIYFYASDHKPSAVILDGKTLYGFTLTAQPAPFPFSLQSYDWTSNVRRDITTIDDFSIEAPIVYDSQTNLIVCTAYPFKLKFVTRTGELKSEFNLPTSEAVTKVFIVYE
jgi:hypothetical protein